MNDDPIYTGRDRDPQREGATIDPFDRKYWELRDVGTRSNESTITVVDGLEATTWIVQTIRVRDLGDFVFLQRVASERQRTIRLVIPPRVCDTLARQRDAVTTRVRSKVARATAADRAAQGLAVGFAAMTPAARAKARQKAAATRRAKAARKRARQAKAKQ